MLWGGRWEGGSCLGTHVRIKDFKILKIKNKIKKKETKKKQIVRRIQFLVVVKKYTVGKNKVLCFS